jgi:F-type H+-transporting ATPase subunit alpha
MTNKMADIGQFLQQEINRFADTTEVKTVGRVMAIGDGIAQVSGLSDVRYQELVRFKDGTLGLALNLEKDKVGVVVLGDYEQLEVNTQVTTTGNILSIGVSDQLVGRIIDPLGRPLDGKGKLEAKNFQPLEKIAPGVIFRQSVNEPLQTGIKAIDAMIPIGLGQRELIIGDRGTGKSSIPLTTIINQKDKGIICIYVAIGQKASFVAQTIATLEKFKALDHTIVVSASASDPASLQYLAPYAGCAIGEYFAQKGKAALIVYDDLSKHAWAYREISLLLRRPSGREAYPGDIFYLHSRLLERACKYADKYGGGSLTALPLIETQAGDISAYIPTNVISITDGQIYLEPDLFYAGIRPAINTGLSVSRVGGAAQIKAMKKVAGKLKLDLAQYRELAAFAQFSSDLDETTKKQLDRGARITEIMKQDWDQPYPVEDQVVVIWAVTNGYMDDLGLTDIHRFEQEYLEYLKNKSKTILTAIRETKIIDEKSENQLKKQTQSFKQLFRPTPPAEMVNNGGTK